jgi:hypothetical protein
MKNDYVIYTIILVAVFGAFYFSVLKPVIADIDEIAKLAAKANKIL